LSPARDDETNVIEDEEETKSTPAIVSLLLRGLVVVAIAAFMGGAVWYARNEAMKGSSATITLSTNKGTQPAGARPAATTPTMPPDIKVLAMLRATMLAVDHGMKTGNFTVLRDLGAASFRKANSAAKLGQIFTSLAAQNVDLLATAVVDPQFAKRPELTPEKMLYLTGIFPIQPRGAAFEVLLELEDGDWRVFAIAIAPVAQ
jgi:hypothetical protein